MEKFDTKKHEKLLKKVAKDTDTNADATIFLILNNMLLYNDLITEYESGKTSKSYLLYQLSGSIFKQLAAFQQVPAKKEKNSSTDESKIFDVINKVNKR